MGVSVARWTWHNQDKRAHRRATANAAELAECRAAAGRNTALQRKTRSGELIVAAARRLAQRGYTPTQAAVLKAVRPRGIKSERTIRRYWSAVRAALPDRTNALALCKKESSRHEHPKSPQSVPACQRLRSPLFPHHFP